MPDAADDFPSGLVFPSLDDAPKRRRVILFVCVVAAAGVALVWPVYPAVSSIRPYILGLPFSLAWVVGWLLVVFASLVVVYRAEEHSTE